MELSNKAYDLCREAENNPHVYCSGGYIYPLNEDEIGSIQLYSKIKEKDGKSVFYTTCDKVDKNTIKIQSQCEFCGGTWDGENWYTGNCIFPEE